jgi:hypothetical protein
MENFARGAIAVTLWRDRGILKIAANGSPYEKTFISNPRFLQELSLKSIRHTPVEWPTRIVR